MIVIKAFASHVIFTANKKDIVHPIGEISADGFTFAKDRGIYELTNKDIRLYTFRSTDDKSYTELSVDYINHISAIVDDIYRQVLKGKASWTDQLAHDLITKFQSIAHDFKVGKIIKDGHYSCPGWVEWKRNHHDAYIRIWFSDEAFRRTYDEYELTVIPPIEVVDNFFKPRNQVLDYLNRENDPVSMSLRRQVAKDYKPETKDPSYLFKWHDPYDPSFTVDTRWDLLIYGPRGDNIDAIKDAIVDYVLEHSAHSLEEWQKIFPDIFKRTEFIIIPRWDLYAIEARKLLNGIYSPMVKYTDIIEVVKKFAHVKYGYNLNHINQYSCVLAHPYRSLQTLVISHPENRDNKFYLTEVYPDYIAENTLSQDFNRMSIRSRTFAEGLTQMIVEAERFNEYSAVPVGMTRLERNKKLYLVKSFENIHYLVAAKVNF